MVRFDQNPDEMCWSVSVMCHDRVGKLFVYEVNHSLTETGVKGGASFEAQARARAKERQRRDSKVGLQELKGIVVVHA